MNYLVYLAGPITGLMYEEATDWREFVKQNINSNIETLSPLRGKQRLREIAGKMPILDSYEDNPLTTAKGINTRDYNDVRRADALLVNFLGAKRVSIGTVMEIAWARAFNKPVICVMEDDNIHNHSMLNYACGYIVKNLNEGIYLIEALLLPDLKFKEVNV